FDLSQYDLVLSDSSSYAKGVITSPKTLHICYCHTPIRYAWDDSHKYIEEFGYPGPIKKIIPFFMNYIRLWDEQAAQRVDYFIANSNFVAKRIEKYYRRQAEVINPPVKASLFYIVSKPDPYFLMVGRFLPYKRFDLAIKAFNQLGWPLKIIGDGPERKKLQAIAKSNIEFIGLVSDDQLKDYYAHCRAFIFPQEEDFGITAVEAMAAGRPVIAYQGGGALEIIESGLTGLFFKEQTHDCLIEALKRFSSINFNPQLIRERALQFDQGIFKEKIRKFIEDKTRN
ncbi:MAG: glycosyltransferase, partial [Patescibacteria group bacterium]